MSFSGMLVADDVNDRLTQEPDGDAREFSDRREFLGSLGKWSTAAIAAIVLSESPDQEATPNGEAWNQGGRGWLNSRGGGGSWVNRRVW